MTILLNDTGNPISRDERNKINENWQRIIDGLTNLQMQIKVLAGGNDVDELIQRLNDAIESANTAVQQAIDANNTATQEAIDANNTALQTALITISRKLEDIEKAISDSQVATSEANDAKQGALDATAQAYVTINNLQSLINHTIHLGSWNGATQYFKNNMVTYNGSTFIALQDNLNKVPPTLPTQSNAYWSLFAEKGDKGSKGEKGDTGAALSILGKLTDPSQLPPTGQAGQAYTVNGELYVWSENLDAWENVGNIKGEKGDTGATGEDGKSAYEVAVVNGFIGTQEQWLTSLKGEKGDKGQDADLTEVNQEITNIKQTVTDNKAEVTEHLDQFDNHVNDNSKHLQSGERGNWNSKQDGFKYYDSLKDLNEIKDVGDYASAFFTNKPDGLYEYALLSLRVEKYSTDWVRQVITYFDESATAYRQWERAYTAGTTWSIWREISFSKLFTSVSDGKAAVNQAVTDMGVYTAPDAPFATTAANIRAIPTGKTVQESTMNVPAFSGSSQVQVDVTFTGGTARNIMAQCGGRLLIHGMYYGTSFVSNGLFVSNIEIIGAIVRFTFNLGSGTGSWVGGSIRYTITS